MEMEMKRVPTEARQATYWVAAITMTYCAISFLTIVIQMIIGIWLHLIYLSALEYGLDLDTPLTNFTGGKAISIIAYPEFSPFRAEDGSVNVKHVGELVALLYLVVVLFSGITLPQMLGANRLMKATEMEMNPRESLAMACLHKNIQIAVCMVEVTFLLLTAVSSFYYMDMPLVVVLGWLFSLIIFVVRFRFLGVVEEFLEELKLEILEDEESWGWKQFKYQSLGDKKGDKAIEKKRKMKESSLGQTRIDIFKICQLRNSFY